jgi:hypothetical protein
VQEGARELGCDTGLCGGSIGLRASGTQGVVGELKGPHASYHRLAQGLLVVGIDSEGGKREGAHPSVVQLKWRIP